MWNTSPLPLAAAIAILAVALAACGDAAYSPSDPAASLATGFSSLSPPGPLSTVGTTGGPVQLWGYTGSNFSGAPQDPVNLIFTGRAKPIELRAALMSLDGDRTALGFPAGFPFNCVWTDAVGGVQTAYDGVTGWLGSAIQLECGAFGPVRFHLRFFDAGAYTLGGAHFEVLIPGTTEHQVLSWTLAQQLVTADFVRSGLLGAMPGATGQLHEAPTFRSIPAVVYNGLPPELRSIANGPASNVATPVGIPNSGVAMLLHLTQSVPIAPEVTRRAFTVPFSQAIPRPFCSTGPLDWVFVSGPVDFDHQVVVTRGGSYTSNVMASGFLEVTPVDVTGMPPTPNGPTLDARVSERYQGRVNGNVSFASMLRQQTILPPGGPGGGRLMESLTIGPGGSSGYDRSEKCGA